MNSSRFSGRLASLLLALASALLPACDAPASRPDERPTDPSSLYLTMYATSFVDVLRVGGTQAGAFEMGRRPGDDGLYHLQIERSDEGRLRTLDVALAARASGLSMVNARLDDLDVFPANSSLGSTLLESQRHADRRAREELGEATPMFHTVDVDLATHWQRYVRLDDLRTAREPSAYCDLVFERDPPPATRVSAMHHRNLMRLGVGSEDAFQRLARAIDWTSESLTQATLAAGIEIDADSNTDYWSPRNGVLAPVGTVFAVRSRLSSRPKALVFVREDGGEDLRLVVARSPLPTEAL